MDPCRFNRLVVIEHDAFQQVLGARPKVAEQISKMLSGRQVALEGERDNLSAAAKARRAAETSSRLLARIRDYFNLG